MKTTPINKLVRDKIPERIEKAGKTCKIEILMDKQYIKLLNEKLFEEVNEYLNSGTVEELADMGEVMHAILEYKKVSIEEFQKIRLKKQESHGGFKKRILLKEVIEE